MLHSAAGKNGLSGSRYQKGRCEDSTMTPGVLELGIQTFQHTKDLETSYTPTEEETLATYEGVGAASEVTGTKAQLLLVPQLPGLGWIFKEKVRATHHATVE